MDFIKIGKLITEKRKAKDLTEQELANMLHLSEKTILDWECGKGFPNILIVLELCNILDITVNELLNDKKLESYALDLHTEENIVPLFYSKRDYNIKKWAVIFIIILNISLIGIATFILPYTNLSTWVKIIILVATFLLLFMSIIPLCALTNSMGRFKCKYCGHKFTPKLSAFIFGVHTWNKRYLKCPNCQKKSFCQFESYKKQNKT